MKKIITIILSIMLFFPLVSSITDIQETLINTTGTIYGENLSVNKAFIEEVFANYYNWTIKSSSNNWLNFNGQELDFNISQFNNTGDLRWVNIVGDTMLGDLDMNNNDLLNINKIYANDWSNISIYDLGDVEDSANDLEFLQYNATSGNWNPISIETTYYNATSSALLYGTLDGGTLENTRHSDGDYDGISLNISEDNTAPGLDIRINFTNVDGFDRGIVRYKTSVLTKPLPIFQIWDYDDNAWEDYETVVESTTFRIAETPVFDDSSHIQNGVVQVRFYKAETGKTNNEYYFDWLAISDGFGTPSGQEIDPIWKKEKVNYSTTSEILAFNYYNATDFDINDYYLKSNPFGFYNSTTLNLSSYVPYTGATQELNLGTNDFRIETGNIYIEDGNLYFKDSNYMYFDYGVSNEYSIRKQTTSLNFQTGGTFNFLSGNVGINNPTPTEKLDVLGNIKSNDTGYFNDLEITNKIKFKDNVTSNYTEMYMSNGTFIIGIY